MSKDALPPHPRIWWDGRDFLWLQVTPGQDPPELYLADTVEDIIAMAEGPAVELHVAVPPAEVRDRAEDVIRDLLVTFGVHAVAAVALAAELVDNLRAAGLLAAEPPGAPSADPIIPADVYDQVIRSVKDGASVTLFGRRYAPVGMSADASLRADNEHLRRELDRARAAEPTGGPCAEQVPGCTRQRSHRHTPIDVRDPAEPTGGTS